MKNERAVRIVVAKSLEFDDLLSKITDPNERRQVIIDGVRIGATHRVEHVRVAIPYLEEIGPGVFSECVRIAQSIGAVTSSHCEQEGWIGTAAHLAEKEGHTWAASRLYERYVDHLESVGKFGLAAQLSLYKLDDPHRAVHDGRLAGSWELVAEVSRRTGDSETQDLASRLIKLLR